MSKPQNERAFQNFIKDVIKTEGGWSSQFHPGMSSDFGIPDLITAVESVGLLPLEVKIGTVDEDHKTLWCSTIRPSQIRWHGDLTSHGYITAFVIGVPLGKAWRVFLLDGMNGNKAKDGLVIGKDITEIDPRYLTTELDSWAEANSYSFE